MTEVTAPLLRDQEFTEEEATAFFARVFRGKHHIPGKLKRIGKRGWQLACLMELNTFDDDYLTRLVIHAHDCAVRVEVGSCNPQRVYIRAFKRSREGDPDHRLYTRHPTIETAIEDFRKGSL